MIEKVIRYFNENKARIDLVCKITLISIHQFDSILQKVEEWICLQKILDSVTLEKKS